MTQLIVTTCGLKKEESPTLIYEDNAACVAQMKEGYIKSDWTKHIPPIYFAYTQDLIKDNQIKMKYVQSSNNSADLFTKALPTSVFKKHVHAIGMQIPGWVPEFADEFDDDDESEEGSKGATTNSHDAFNFDDADDVDKVSETELDDPLEQNKNPSEDPFGIYSILKKK
ncbi:hypothetical protein Tco_1114108 [Tanacetum coccineum]|uniref:Uncharacterized protein n=1 Tax=Tanacetum coccineum TaxID=301880 RepID=A0ABQ5IVL0_9ASTR